MSCAMHFINVLRSRSFMISTIFSPLKGISEKLQKKLHAHLHLRNLVKSEFGLLCYIHEDCQRRRPKQIDLGLILMLFWANAKSASEHNYSNAHSRQLCRTSLSWYVGGSEPILDLVLIFFFYFLIFVSLSKLFVCNTLSIVFGSGKSIRCPKKTPL